MGCLVGLFTFPVMFIRWCIANGWKGLIVGGIVAVVLFAGIVTVKSSCDAKPNQEAKLQQAIEAQQIPSVKQAPFLVTTISRYYYAKEAKQKDGITTMTVYWELTNGKWERQDYLELPESEYGKVTVSKRR